VIRFGQAAIAHTEECIPGSLPAYLQPSRLSTPSSATTSLQCLVIGTSNLGPSAHSDPALRVATGVACTTSNWLLHFHVYRRTSCFHPTPPQSLEQQAAFSSQLAAHSRTPCLLRPPRLSFRWPVDATADAPALTEPPAHLSSCLRCPWYPSACTPDSRSPWPEPQFATKAASDYPDIAQLRSWLSPPPKSISSAGRAVAICAPLSPAANI